MRAARFAGTGLEFRQAACRRRFALEPDDDRFVTEPSLLSTGRGGISGEFQVSIARVFNAARRSRLFSANHFRELTMTADDSDSVRDLVLVIAEGGETRRAVLSGVGPWSIGRGEACDVVVSNRRASRIHARLTRTPQGFVVEDCESSTGLSVDGEKVTRRLVREGSTIGIGDARIGVGRAPGRESPPAPAREEAPAADDKTSAARREPPANRAGSPRRAGSERPRPARRGARAGRSRSIVGPIIVLLVFGAAGGGVWWILDRDDAADTEPESAGGGSSTASTPTGSPTIDLEGLTDAGSAQAEADLESLIRDARRGESVDVTKRLETIRRDFPDTYAAHQAERYLAVVRAADTRQRQFLERAREMLENDILDKKYSRAVLAAAVLAEAEREQDGSRWARRATGYREAALERFRELEGELSRLTSDGKPDDAIRRLIAAAPELGGLDEFQSALLPYLEAGLSGVDRDGGASGEITPRVIEVRNRASVAFERCRFSELVALQFELLAENPPPEFRLQAFEGLVNAFYWQRMLRDFFEFVRKESAEVELVRGRVLNVVSADADGIAFELRNDGASARFTRGWEEMPAATKFRLFRAARLRSEGLIGLALFALSNSDEDGAHNALVRLHRIDRSRPLAASILSRHRGIPVPDDGFVEFEGRLLTRAEKTAALAARRQRHEEKLAAARRLRELKTSNRLGAFLTSAIELRSKGSFTLAQSILREIVRQYPKSDSAKKAAELAVDPLLQVHSLAENGRAENRLDIHILGDGYPYDDDYQEGFYNSAVLTKNLILATQPFREYASYVNIYAVNAGSTERGLDRKPGEVERETAFDGIVEWDRFTVNRGKVREFLGRLGEPGKDQQAVVIGNDYAGVSTGGGGVACCCKTSLSVVVHEIGHSFAGLRDEYDYEPGNDPNRPKPEGRDVRLPTKALPPNAMQGSDRDDVLEKVLWRHWVNAPEDKIWNGSKVGVFEGADRKPVNHWRPQADCRMRNAGSEFCVVCMEQMVLTLYKYVRPIDEVEPAEATVAVSRQQTAEFRVYPMKPEGRFLEVAWHIQEISAAEEGTTVVVEKRKGDPVRKRYRRVDANGRVIEGALIEGRKLRKGRYRLRVDVRDTTPWVLKDDAGRLTQTHEWTLEVP